MIRRFLAVFVAALVGSSAAIYGAPALADQVRDKQWHLSYLKVAEAHKMSTGKGVTVAVIDTGVASHPDLSGSVLKGIDYVSPGGTGQSDVDGHGTGMAGLIAAHGSGQSGAQGIAPDAKILPIRILKSGPRAAEVGRAIQWAVDHGADVINLSIGGGVDPATLDALAAAAKANVVVVAGAGNKPDAFGVTAPAFVPSVIAVTAVDRQGKLDPISATGPEVDLAAPGTDIETTRLNSGYREGTGTSDASAIVAGAAALVRSKYPDLSATEIMDRLESTADDKGTPGLDNQYGHGVVNLVAALSAPAGSAQPSAGPSATTASPAPTADSSAGSGAAPNNEPASSNGLLVFGGVLVVVVLVAGLVGFLMVRRRKGP
jgi:type VII secretion-associated serine protease mycosin